MRHVLLRSLLGATAGALLVTGMSVGVAQAAPQPGKSCGEDGTSMYAGGSKIVKKTTYLCLPDGSNAKWSKPLAQSKTKGVMVMEPSVKVPTSMMPGMTAAYGKLMNNTKKPVRIIGGFTDVAEMVQLHMTVNGKMMQEPDGFVIAPGETLTLQTGGNHIMLMGVKSGAIKAGESVTINLVTITGAIVKYKGVARDYSGGNESYGSSSSMSMG